MKFNTLFNILFNTLFNILFNTRLLKNKVLSAIFSTLYYWKVVKKCLEKPSILIVLIGEAGMIKDNNGFCSSSAGRLSLQIKSSKKFPSGFGLRSCVSLMFFSFIIALHIEEVPFLLAFCTIRLEMALPYIKTLPMCKVGILRAKKLLEIYIWCSPGYWSGFHNVPHKFWSKIVV